MGQRAEQRRDRNPRAISKQANKREVGLIFFYMAKPTGYPLGKGLPFGKMVEIDAIRSTSGPESASKGSGLTKEDTHMQLIEGIYCHRM